MTPFAVKCGCGRTMATDGRVGRHAYRCGCGTRVQVADRPNPVRRCSYGDCRTVAVTQEPLRFCLDHEKAAASRLGPLAGTLELELFLNSSASTRYRRFGDAISAPKKISKHPPLVYYMRREWLIKIGTSTTVRYRASTLGTRVLASEAGGEGVEKQRHRQFDHLREFGEWFRPGPDLLAHVKSLRRLHGRAILF